MERERVNASATTIAPAGGLVQPGGIGHVGISPPAGIASILIGVDDYLARSAQWYERGDDQYYARICLAEAQHALRAGNYGIGAVVLDVAGDHISEYRAGNRMITGLGLIDHAETAALLEAAGSQREPDDVYRRDLNAQTRRLSSGLHVYGTLEPCPMCACVATNARAVRSVSTVPDGEPCFEGSQLVGSNGGATVLGVKARLQPEVWQAIQRGLGLEFDLLQTRDVELRSLSQDIFAVTREEIDARLATRADRSLSDSGFSSPALD